MGKLGLIMIVVLAFGIGLQSTLAAENCSDSMPTLLAPDLATTGQIARAFSTHRLVPGEAGVRVLAPATFKVLGQSCINGLSWIELEYTSGTTEDGGAASALGVGWALESQLGSDEFGAGRWLEPVGSTVNTPIPVPTATPQPIAVPTATPVPASAGGECPYSLEVLLGPGLATTGHIAQSFSTFRPAPGKPGVLVLAPATFNVLGQECSGGFSWINLQYTSGKTEDGSDAALLGTGWALESQTELDEFGQGRWLAP